MIDEIVYLLSVSVSPSTPVDTNHPRKLDQADYSCLFIPVVMSIDCQAQPIDDDECNVDTIQFLSHKLVAPSTQSIRFVIQYKYSGFVLNESIRTTLQCSK